jgi:hypothetical protein
VVGFHRGGAFHYAAKLEVYSRSKQQVNLLTSLVRDRVDACPFLNVPRKLASGDTLNVGVTDEYLKAMVWVLPKRSGRVRFIEWTRAGLHRHATISPVSLASDRTLDFYCRVLEIAKLIESVRYTVDCAEDRFKKCWGTLVSLQQDNLPEGQLVNALISFQPELGDALFALANLKKILSGEREVTIKEKARHNYAEFRSYLKELRDLQKALEAAIDVGKAIGDAYAWLYYQRERELLHRHFAHEKNPDPATGVGGKAEVEFIRRSPKFGQYILIWHGMTSFLRVGDISMIDPTTSRVMSIAELKAKQDGDKTTIQILMDNTRLDSNKLPVTDSPKPGQQLQKPFLNSRGMNRLKRQIQEIKHAFTAGGPNPGRRAQQLGVTYLFQPVVELATLLQTKDLAVSKADRGLALIGVQLSEARLFERLRRRMQNENLDDCIPVLRSICDRSLEGNQLRPSSLVYSVHRYSLRPWARPSFWWDLPLYIREALVFRKLIVLSWYNPAFFFEELRSMGLRVETERRNFKVSKPRQEGDVTLLGLDRLLQLVESELLPDTAIVDFVKRSIQVAEKLEGGHGLIHVNPEFIFN